MRLVLDKEDLVRVLEQHFGERLDPARVQVRTNPLEVELSGIPLTVSAEAAEPKSEEDRGRELGLAEGFTGPTYVKPAPSGMEDPELARSRAERNVSFTPPPFAAEETLDDPAAVVRQSEALALDLSKER